MWSGKSLAGYWTASNDEGQIMIPPVVYVFVTLTTEEGGVYIIDLTLNFPIKRKLLHD